MFRSTGALPVRWIVVPLLLAACSPWYPTPSGPSDPEPPVLPAVTTLAVDIDLFIESPGDADEPGDHWWYASGVIGGIRNVTEPVLDMPRAVLRGAHNRTPTLLEGVWRWSVLPGPEDQFDSGELRGTVDATGVEWAGRVSASGFGLTNALLFTGRSVSDGTSGTWTIWHVQVDPGRVLAEVEWTRPSAERSTLALRERRALDPFVESDLLLTIDGGARTLHQARRMDLSEEFVWDAGWSLADRTGFIQVPVFAGGDPACWGTRLENVPCSP